MSREDEGKGFKGLGRLGGTRPPPVPPPPVSPPPAPFPQTPPASSSAGQGGGGSFTPPPKSSSGCLKVGVVLVVMLVLAIGMSMLIGGLFSPAKVDPSYDAAIEPGYDSSADTTLDPQPDAIDHVEAARLAAEEAAAAQERARVAACRIDAGTRPENGEVLIRGIGEGGHHLKVNGGVNDALIKLRRDGQTALAFYVRSFETVEITDIPDGTFQVMFAGGSDYSRSCNEFVTGMSVSADPEPVVFEITEQADGSYYAIMEYTLQQQAGGNFQPEYVDPADFRD